MKEVFEKSVQKAIDNGWNVFGFEGTEGFKWFIGNRTQEAFVLICKNDKIGVFDYRPTEVFFNHQFAKAFFGKGWKKHLKEMVLSNVYNYLNVHL